MSGTGFERIASADVAALGVTVEQYRHLASGARHLHVASAERNNAFLLGFLTPPPDDSGVVHILEHLTLSGSRRFPMRDAFFRMLHRSLATTMNARTSVDSTSFHFATSDERDFDHLLALYLDAAFFALLDPLDFAREGHRVEFARPQDVDSPLVRHGVVWNEMRGAMASPARLQRQALNAALFPDACYRHNPGGDPARIPLLDHHTLRVYHARHYCAANAVFMTAGSIPAARHQARFETLALSCCEAGERVWLSDVPRFDAPRRTRQACAGGARPGAHLLVGWLLGHADDAGEALRAAILDHVLLGDDDAPLRALLEGHPGARAAAAICGLDDMPREMVFGCGLQATAADTAERLEGDCLSVLADVAANGVAERRLGAILDRVALQRRAPEAGRQPAGLALLMRMLPGALRGGDPVAIIDVDAALRELRSAARDPAWLPGLVRTQLLGNPHRACVTLIADPSLATTRDTAEQRSLHALARSLRAEERARIVEQARRIAAGEPRRGEDVSLPCLSRADVDPVAVTVAGARTQVGALPVTRYPQAASGVTHLLLALDAGTAAVRNLALLCELLPHLGCGALDARAAQARQVALCAGLAARLRVRAAPTDAADASLTVTLSARALDVHRVELADMLVQTLREPWLDDEAQLRALLARCHARRAEAFTDAGHRFAMSAAADGATRAATLQESADGLRALAMLREVQGAAPEAMSNLLGRLRETSDGLCAAVCEVALIDDGQGDDDEQLAAALAPLAATGPAGRGDPAGSLSATSESTRAPAVRACDSEVGFLARAWPAPPVEHVDAAVLAVLGPLVADGFLHAALRERGGAYGAGAMYDADSATFRLFSYRDPRIAGTLGDFDRVPAWVEQVSEDAQAVERAVLRAIAAGEAGGSAADDAMRAFLDARDGRDADHRQRWREALLAVDGAALRRVADRWLSPAAARDAVIASEAALTAAGLLGRRETPTG